MKRILLASASIVAFAGAAAAEVTFSGTATLGYNDTDNLANVNTDGDDEIGFYWEADLNVVFSQALDNGLTASANFGFNVADDANLGQTTNSRDYVLSLTSDTAGLFFGNTQFAAFKHWASAGDMETDFFSEEDGQTVLRGDITFGGVNASVSYALDVVTDNDLPLVDETDSLEQLSIGADATFGAIKLTFGYQEATDATGGAFADGDFNPNEVFGISAGTSFAGADVVLAYSKDNTAGEDSLGVKASYPVGPVTLTAYYVMESAAAGDNFGVAATYTSGPVSVTVDYQSDQEVNKTAIDATYDVGNGITALAGYYMQDDLEDDFYVAAKVALGEGASLLVSYADGGGDGEPDDEIGGPNYQEGTTVEVGFSF